MQHISTARAPRLKGHPQGSGTGISGQLLCISAKGVFILIHSAWEG
jgi:hypothetical protein